MKQKYKQKNIHYHVEARFKNVKRKRKKQPNKKKQQTSYIIGLITQQDRNYHKTTQSKQITWPIWTHYRILPIISNKALVGDGWSFSGELLKCFASNHERKDCKTSADHIGES